jgi:signal transduction histidine kinase
VVTDVLRSLWDEPRAANAPHRTAWDWILVGVLVPVGVAEAVLRPGIEMRPAALVFGVAPVLTLLWRRSHPLLAVVIAYGLHAAVEFVPVFGHNHDETSLFITAFVLILPYSLLRWGSGRESVIGILVILGSHTALLLGSMADDGSLAEVAGIAILLLPAALGAAVRYRTVWRVREIDQVKLREREQLARELHDTVAHHVSAIAISAQAGRAVAATDPEAAVTALRVIEAEASRTLTEMRTMVGVLRRGAEPDLTPQLGIADLHDLARRVGPTPTVEVVHRGDLDDLAPSVDAAVYRLAQESITNAVRHARRARRVRVDIDGEPDCIRLTVTDDGDAGSLGAGATGYGIVGMTERATLLGGTLEAGPNRERGWTVTAVLPRAGVSA